MTAIAVTNQHFFFLEVLTSGLKKKKKSGINIRKKDPELALFEDCVAGYLDNQRE